MASTGKNSLRRWEYPTGSGIRVQEIINRNASNDHGLSYRVAIPARLAGTREFRQFSTLDAAETWAASQNRAIAEHGRRHFALATHQRDEAIEALAILDPEAGQRSAILYSIMISCLRHGIEPLAYLRDVLSRVAAMTNQDDFDPLLPSRWKPRS